MQIGKLVLPWKPYPIRSWPNKRILSFAKKKKKELLRLLLFLSQTISVQLTLDVFKFDNGSCL